MAFRGSANVKDGDYTRMLERIGLRFGSDTNASTGQEETIYQFDLPRSDDASVDTAFTLSREIAGNLPSMPDAAHNRSRRGRFGTAPARPAVLRRRRWRGWISCCRTSAPPATAAYGDAAVIAKGLGRPTCAPITMPITGRSAPP